MPKQSMSDFLKPQATTPASTSVHNNIDYLLFESELDNPDNSFKSFISSYYKLRNTVPTYGNKLLYGTNKPFTLDNLYSDFTPQYGKELSGSFGIESLRPTPDIVEKNTLRKIWEKVGKPYIKQSDHTHRASFHLGDKTDTLKVESGNVSDLFAEMAHSEQFKGDKSKRESLKKQNQQEYIKLGDYKRYETKGTVEHTAHSMIEPKLWDNFWTQLGRTAGFKKRRTEPASFAWDEISRDNLRYSPKKGRIGHSATIRKFINQYYNR
tara:strand:+ start:2042 stop:2839 length:798 start_codon:yes stop_codon:yes gene_type:complete